MHSLIYDPKENEYTILNENKYGNKPFIRKILTIRNLDDLEKECIDTELEILENIKNNSDNNLIKIYDLKKPTAEEDGYVDMEIYSVFVDYSIEYEEDMIIEKNEDLYDINKEIKIYIYRIQDDIQKCLTSLHKIGIVYINLDITNIVYSYEDSCWKLIDFANSGILNQTISQTTQQIIFTDDWKVAPNTVSRMYSHVHEEDINKLRYDTKAFEIFALQLKQFINQ